MATVAVTLLDREVYTEAQAARLLDVHQSTLHYWLEGGDQGGRPHPPIIRVEPTGQRVVTWGEFVEAGLLREYRRLGTPMGELRGFIEILRDRLGVPYPLAHQRPLVARGHGLVMEAQEESGLDPALWLVTKAGDQGMLSYTGQSFMDRVTWDGGTAKAYRPHNDPGSLVRIDPLVRFGKPAVGGISTAVLQEQHESGADTSEIAEDFGLSESQVTWALAYEATTRRATRRTA